MLMNRCELVFLYDISDSNPNGDPMDENKPRIDEETGINLVTDVRLKRTIRDYLHDFKGKEIFVREIRDENDNLQDAKLRAEDFLFDESGEKINKAQITVAQMKNIIGKNVLSECIDVRLFGATIPIEKNQREKGSITFTGPVQFKMGKSLHAVNLIHIKGTGAFASGSERKQATFREEYFLSYSLIGFYGVVNENAAASTQLTEDDLDLLAEALWKGTKNLISRSKAGQMPRFLLKIIYKEPNYHIGEIDKYIALNKVNESMRDEELRDITQIRLDLTALMSKLNENTNKIDKVEYAVDSRVSLLNNGEAFNINNGIDGITFTPLKFA